MKEQVDGSQQLQQTSKFIVVAGNIGSGKTTLTQKLADHFGWMPHYESVADNPYLEDFYADIARWSFPLQIHFRNHRFQAHCDINASFC